VTATCIVMNREKEIYKVTGNETHVTVHVEPKEK